MSFSSRRLASPPEPALQGDWRRAIDAATGRDYYYHRITRETTWTLPSLPERSPPVTAAKENVPHAASPASARGDVASTGVVDTVTGFVKSASSQRRSLQAVKPAQNVDFEQVQRDLALLKRRMQETSAAPSSSSSSSAAHKSPPAAQRRTAVAAKPQTPVDPSQPPKRQPPMPAKAASSTAPSSNAVCTRKSGCTCEACAGGGLAPSADEAGDERLPCPTCDRPFNASSLAIHARVCKKVFSKPAPAAASSSPPRASPATTPSQQAPAGVSKWRRQSAELRSALTRAAGATTPSSSPALAEERAADDGLVQCPHCERRFSDKAAERHIPRCNDIRSKPKTLKRGEGRAAYTPSPDARAEAKTPGSASQAKRKTIASRLGASETCAKCGARVERGSRHECHRDSSSSWDGKEDW